MRVIKVSFKGQLGVHRDKLLESLAQVQLLRNQASKVGDYRFAELRPNIVLKRLSPLLDNLLLGPLRVNTARTEELSDGALCVDRLHKARVDNVLNHV